MKKVLFLLAIIIGINAYQINIKNGWQLKGALENINVAKVFDKQEIISVWAYDDENNQWKVYLPNINIDLDKFGVKPLSTISKGEGFWINASNNLFIETNINENIQNIDENITYNDEESNTTIETNISENTSEESPTTLATAKLGNLADANVTIYKIENNGIVTLKWNETTSSGDTLNEIGKFNIHANEMEDNSFYLIKVKGGCDWDVEDDGIIDTNCTQNKGIIRAIAKGRDIKSIGNSFKVTLVSEIVFEKVIKYLYNDFNKTTFESNLTKAIKEIIVYDIDGDGKIDVNDMAKFDPVNDIYKLADDYQIEFQNLLTTIHLGKIPSLNSIDYKIGYFDTNGDAYSVVLSKDETKAYIADEDNGLVILDVNNPINPIQIGHFDTDGYAYDVILSNDGTKVYVADWANGLVILDISNDNNITQIGHFDDSWTWSVTLSHNETKAYIVDLVNADLTILDVSDESNITKIGYFNTYGDYAGNIVLSKDETKAYFAANEYLKNLIILDVNDESNITEIGHFYTYDGIARDVVLSKDETKAYVAYGYKGLVILDISNPSNPSKIGHFYTYDNGYAESVVLSKDETKAYIAYGYKGLVILDISNPSNPIQIANFDINGYARDVVLSKDETKAYIANKENGLLILDLNLLKDY